MQRVRLHTILLLSLVAAACTTSRSNAGNNDAAPAGAAPGAASAQAQLDKSPRHGEYVMIDASTGGQRDSVRAYVVYPERKSKAPVVVVVHEIYGLSTWIRSVADQLAAEGYIAVAPDFTTGKGVTDQSDSSLQRVGPGVIRSLTNEEVQRRISAAGRYGMNLPAAEKRYGVVGFCWGGSTVFNHAVASADVGAVVVYYGSAPAPANAARIRAPILGLFGENDARVNMSIPPMDSAMKALGKTFEHETFAGAGHGFLRQQDGQNGANRAAAEKAWPRTIAFFRQHIGR